MTTRGTHLVGTIPAADTEAALGLARDHLGTTLRWLPDGETGPRKDWILPVVEGLKTHPDLELVRDGNWSAYDDIPRLRVRKGHTLSGLDFGYLEHFRAGYPAFRLTRDE